MSRLQRIGQRFRNIWTERLLARLRLWNFRLTLLASCSAIVTIPIVIVQWRGYLDLLRYLPVVLVAFVHHIVRCIPCSSERRKDQSKTILQRCATARQTSNVERNC